MGNRHYHLVQRVAATCCVLIFAALLSAQTPPAAKPGAKTQRLFWKITSPTTEIYFLGSIHVASPDMYPLPPEIEAAYKKADNLVVEADVTKVDQGLLLMQVAAHGLYGADDSLSKHVSPETMKQLEQFCTANNFSSAILNTMKPPLAAITVESVMMLNLGLNPEDGIDYHFLKQANAEKKKVVELEKADSQLNLLFGIDDKLAEKWLVESIKDSGKAEAEKLVKAWKEGEVKVVESIAIDDAKKDPDEQKLNDLMIYKRNDEMTKKIGDMLAGKEKVFLVVGAAHLVGEKGILKQLEAKGYKVERPELTVPSPTTRPSLPSATRPALPE